MALHDGHVISATDKVDKITQHHISSNCISAMSYFQLIGDEEHQGCQLNLHCSYWVHNIRPPCYTIVMQPHFQEKHTRKTSMPFHHGTQCYSRPPCLEHGLVRSFKLLTSLNSSKGGPGKGLISNSTLLGFGGRINSFSLKEGCISQAFHLYQKEKRKKKKEFVR